MVGVVMGIVGEVGVVRMGGGEIYGGIRIGN